MKKIVDFIKKLFGGGSSDSSNPSNGFTLIELLVVIAVIGILAAALLIAIDPVDKINAGNDTKVVNNVRSIYDAANRYYVNNNDFPTAGAGGTMVTSGELKNYPNPPTNYAAYGYSGVLANGDASICGQVKSKAQKIKQTVNGAGPVPAGNVYVFINAGQLCYTTTVCTNGTYYTPATAGTRCL